MDSLPSVPSLPTTTSAFDGLTTFIRENAILMLVIFTILLVSSYLNFNFLKTLYQSMKNIVYLSAKGTSDVVEPGLDQIQLLTKPEYYKRQLNNNDSDTTPQIQQQPQQQVQPQQHVQPQVQEQPQEEVIQLSVEQPNTEGYSSLKPMTNKKKLSLYTCTNDQ